MNDILDILINFGGGKGGEASGTVVRFLLPTFFWLILSSISGSEWRRTGKRRELYMSTAAIVGASRELLMFMAEYGSGRGYFQFDIFYRYYPPLEHAATMFVGIFIAYAFMGYGGTTKRFQNLFLIVGSASILILYLLTATGWPNFLLLHPKISFGLYWGDLSFRITGSLLLGTATVGFILDKMRGGRVPAPLVTGIIFFLLDELLMIVNIASSEKYVDFFSPIRHNLHIWAVPLFIGTYWSELKHQSRQYEAELKQQHANLSENNVYLEQNIAVKVAELERKDWFNTGLNQLNSLMRSDQTPENLANASLSFLIKYLKASVGVFYLSTDSGNSLQVLATYALMGSSPLMKRISVGQGLPGQAVSSRKMIRLFPVPADYLPIGSALGESTPLEIIVLPIIEDSNVVAVIEVGSFTKFTSDYIDFMNRAAEAIGIAITVNQTHHLMNELLLQTQSQSEELRVQQEELQQTNEELSERVQMLADRGKE